MAYCRYDKDCDWYIFWQATSSDIKEDQVLAVWHCDHRAKDPTINYFEAKRALKNNDFSIIPGYSEKDFDIVNDAVREFVQDVNNEY